MPPNRVGYNKAIMHPLAQQISDFIQADPQGVTDDDFNGLAVALFTYQYGGNAPFRRLCDSEGRRPQTITRWQDIPAVPASAFKAFELSCVPTNDTVAVFHSSGTTGPQTSRHFLDADALALYETSLRRGFQRALPQRPPPLCALMPPPDAAPHSSLSHMLGTLGAQRFFWNDDAALAAALRELREPVTLFGTAFAFVQLFDAIAGNLAAPDRQCAGGNRRLQGPHPRSPARRTVSAF